LGTPFEKVIDMALLVIQDFRLDNLYNVNKATFDLLFEGWLRKAKPKFVGCLQSLDIDLETKSFISILSDKEIDILADGIVIVWFTNKVQDVSEFGGHMSDSEFKKHSEANNLAKKKEYLDGLQEKMRQDITDYHIQNLDKLVGFI